MGLAIEEGNLLSRDSAEALLRMEGVSLAELSAEGTIEALTPKGYPTGGTQETTVIRSGQLIEGDGMTEVSAQGGDCVGLTVSEAANDLEIAT